MALNILKFRKSNERFKSKREWLDSKHSFSFAEHRDPSWDNFGKIRVINEDIISPNSGFGTHSHSNMEIVTIVTKGEISHRDSLNNVGIIHEDEVQIMSAGTGISHSEKNEKNSDCKLFQIWIYPDIQDLKPSYRQISIKSLSGNNLIINSSKKNNSQLLINQDISIWRCKYNTCDKKYLPSELERFNWIQIIEGNLLVRDKNNNLIKTLFSGDGLGFEISDFCDINIQSDKKVDMLLFSMKSI
ncbi:DUF209 [Prochlorococcus marinus str. MIT 9515]|uniref:DUF209 n=1 Tax=Prochlorococcus marinus (strain MIT 9515) TaxID=167542 RepID=A2BY77_PROM5|nr:pirin-like bicupin family protein [Prochlorococcus marinus]ABM72738.1 DUF209 [Prochlorococcus marinus str. MIT 9515]